MRKLKKKVVSIIIIFVMILNALLSVNTLKTEAATASHTYDYKVKTGDNLISPANSVFHDASDKVAQIPTNGLTGKFTLDNWKLINELSGKEYKPASNWISGGYDGKIGGGARFADGQNRIPIADLGLSDTTTDATFSFWFNWDGRNAVMPLSSYGWDLYVCDGSFGINTYNSDIYGISNPFKPGVYYHVTFVMSKENLAGCKLYINGVQQTMTQRMSNTWVNEVRMYSGTDAKGTLNINGHWNPSEPNYRMNDGYIDELYVWNRALTKQEVMQVVNYAELDYSYLNGLTGKFSFEDITAVKNSVNNKTYSFSGTQRSNNGESGFGLLLNGGQIGIPFSDLGATTSTTHMTVSFWFRWDGTENWCMPIGGAAFSLYLANGSFGFNTAQGDIYGIPNPFIAGKYIHVTAIIAKNNINGCKLYIEGKKQNLAHGLGDFNGPALSSNLNFNYNLNINGWGNGTGYTFGPSYIDEVWTWNRALSDREVQSLETQFDDGRWRTFQYNYLGSSTVLDVVKGGPEIGGNNYLKLTGQATTGDSGANIKINNIKKNTDYTFSGYVRLPKGTTNFGNGLFFITNKANTSHLQSVSLPGTTPTDWTRISGVFNSGDNDVIHWRINKGAAEEIDVTGLKLEEGRYATPYISHSSIKTYNYGFADNLISPHDARFLNDKNNHIPNQSYPNNNWRYLGKGGVGSTSILAYGGYNGNNYYRIVESGGSGYGDTGIQLEVPNLYPNTDYTISVAVKIPQLGTQVSNLGTLSITDVSEKQILGSYDLETKAQAVNWTRLTGTFNSGANTSIKLRVARGGIKELQVTDFVLVGGKDSIPHSDGKGYSSILRPTTVTFTPNSNTYVNHHDPIGKVSGRTVFLSERYTDGAYYRYSSQAAFPSNIKKAYYDSVTGQTLNFDLSRTSIPTSIDSKLSPMYSISYGKRYDPIGHTTLGYMSNNTRTYWSGTYSFNNAPRRPIDYYGPEEDKSGWTLVEFRWDDPYVRDSYDALGYGQLWVSDGNGTSGKVTKNRYRKGVFLKYTKSITEYKWAADYSGTFSLPDAVDRYDDYDVCKEFNARVTYSGDLLATNLKAISIAIVNSDNDTQVTEVQQGVTYRAKITFKNNGATDVPSFEVGVYEDNSLNNGIVVNSLKPGESVTRYVPFTPITTGQRTFKMVVDDGNKITEIDESAEDNEKATSVNCFRKNIVAASIDIYDSNNKVVSTVQAGKSYKAKVKLANDGQDNIGPFTVGLYSDLELKSQIGTDVLVNSLSVNETKLIDIPFVASYTQSANTFVGFADNKDIINESNEDDNVTAVDKTGIMTNLTALSISIVNENDDKSPANLEMGRTYRAKVVIRNSGNDYIQQAKIGLEENGAVIGFGDITDMNPGDDKVTYITFIENYSGPRKFSAKADYYDVIPEINELDNTVATSSNSVKVNVKVNDVKILDYVSDTEPTELIQNKLYRAKINVTNDGDIDLNNFNVGLYKSDLPMTVLYGSKKTISLVKGASTDVYINFKATDRGLVGFAGYADCDNKIVEYDESDNIKVAIKQVKRLNLKLTSIKIVGATNEIEQTKLLQGDQYRAKVTLANDGDIDLTSFDISLSEDNNKIGAVNVPGLSINNTMTSYITFTANKVGDNIEFRADGDYENKLDESDETDNTVKIYKVVLPLNHAPIANFNVSPNPQLVNTNLSYVDMSDPRDSWDSIVIREWSYSSDGGTTWSDPKPDPPISFSSPGNYKIRLRVKDMGNELSPGLWSDYCIKDQMILPINNKPIACFTVNPKEEDIGIPIAYNDLSYDPDSWDTISAREWSYQKADASGNYDMSNNSSRWIVTGAKPQMSFSQYGNYRIRLRVKDTGNLLSGALWSDYYYQDVTIKSMLDINASLSPNPARAGQKIVFDINTKGYAKILTVYFPTEIYNLDSKNLPLTKVILEEPFHNEKISYYLPLDTPRTIDEDGYRLRAPYLIQVKAEKADGRNKSVTLQLDVQGSILDGIITEIK